MKHSINRLFVCCCLLFAGISPIFAQTQVGLRFFYQNDFVKPAEQLVQGPAAGEWEYGGFIRRQFGQQMAARLETNFTIAKYKLSAGKHYGALKFCALPEWQISPVFALGAGAFVDVLLFDAFDTQKDITNGVLVHAGLRYGHVEIQCRFQRSFVQNHKYGLGAGLAYYFGADKAPPAKATK